MKKEVFLAIAIGFALGLIITFGIWTANKSLASIKPAQPTPEQTPLQGSTPIPTSASNNSTPAASSSLSITSPDDETLTNQSSVTITGKTYANATVVLTSEGNQQVILADTAGQFSTPVNLIAGYNVINITAFDQTGSQASQMLTVTYSTAKI